MSSPPLPPSSAVAQPSFLHHPATTAESCDIGRLTTDTPPDDALLRRQTSFAQYAATTATNERCDAGPLKIDVLPDDVLLGIFASYLSRNGPAWPTLVHVCQRWRNVVLGSPRHLKLRLYCTGGKPASVRMLDIWPPLPIVLDHINPSFLDMINIIAVLRCNHRVRDIGLKRVASLQLEIILAAGMSVSFPALTHLTLISENEMMSVVPDSFLGGFAPRLRSLFFDRIPFPGLPKVLLSATNLVRLTLHHIPHSGYISPEAMVTCLTTLTKLEFLSLIFQSSRRPPDQESRRPPPSTRSVLPALTIFMFRGVSEYLEDLVARIDTPLPHEYWHLGFDLFYQPILDTPQLAQFLSRIPKLETCKEAHAILNHKMVAIRLYLPSSDMPRFFLKTTCKVLDQQLSFLAQVSRSSLSVLPSLEHLYLLDRSSVSHEQDPDDFEKNQWLEILRPFSAAKNLYLSKEIVPRIAPALQLVGESLTAVLPSLESLFLEKPYPSGPVEDAIGKFITARQLSDRPIIIRDWDGLPWSGRG